MNNQNGINQTEEFPAIFPPNPVNEVNHAESEPQSPTIYPENGLEPPANLTVFPQNLPSSAGAFSETAQIPVVPPQNKPPVHPVSATHPPRQPIRRASMSSTENPEEPVMPYRRPPQQKNKPVKRESSESEPKKKRKRRKKRKSCLGKLIASFITLLLVIFTIYSVISVWFVKKLQYQTTGDRSIEENSISIQDDDVKNYLLIGTTSRRTEKGKADSIHLLSVSSHNHSFTFSTISPDCRINIPQNGEGLLKDAYSYGGPTLLMDTITNEFGIPIDHYFCVGFSAFANLADSLGGLEFNISEKEMNEINEMLKDGVNSALTNVTDSDFLKSSGKMILNGKQLLAYSHLKDSAKAGLSDLSNQKIVWDGLLNKVKNMDFSTVKKVAKDALPIVTTNLDTLQLYGLSLKLPYHLIRYDFQSLSLPFDGTFKEETDENGVKALTVKYDDNLQKFRSAMTTPILKQE